ncbi:hypothetical protein J7K24_00960 [bacterium]|nr:hypothetical protein [bacterium]
MGLKQSHWRLFVLTKKDGQQILSIKGEIRGIMNHMADAVRKKAREEEVKKVEGVLEKVGCSMLYNKLKQVRFCKIREILLYLMSILRKYLTGMKRNLRKWEDLWVKTLLFLNYFLLF